MSIQQWHNDTLGKKVVEQLKKNEFDAVYFSDREEAVKHVLEYISQGNTVGIGGSMTLQQLRIPELAREKGAEVLDHNLPELSAEEKMEIRRRQLTSDVFLSSTNALTLDGCLVNIDGVGNRVAAMTFGPRKVVIVAGVNKICKDVHSALQRIQMTASPQNNKRLNLPNPCAAAGVCSDCRSKTRTCRAYSIMKRKPMTTDITVVVIGENLGY
ncbi:MAG: lactate utilization protein [Desulfotomaculum sp.]|nr:lactate utilization protein [Desulfotomaculum sp.]